MNLVQWPCATLANNGVSEANNNTYCDRNNMKPRVVYALITFVWIIAVALLFLSKIISGPPYLLWQYGAFIHPSSALGVVILYVLLQVASAIMIIGPKYLHHAIIRIKKKLEKYFKLSEEDEIKVKRLQQSSNVATIITTSIYLH